MSDQGPALEDLLAEDRTFEPPAGFKGRALVHDSSMFKEASADYTAFWERQARELLTWTKPWNRALEWNLPFSKWFIGGELNVSYNCLDRHVEAGKADRV